MALDVCLFGSRCAIELPNDMYAVRGKSLSLRRALHRRHVHDVLLINRPEFRECNKRIDFALISCSCNSGG